MQALVYTTPGQVELREWNEPTPRYGEVLLRVRAAAICGSDLHGFLGHSKIRVPPMVMGHEFAGDIIELGPGVTGLAVGDRVTVQPILGCGQCRDCHEGHTNSCANRRLMGGQLQGAFAERIAVPQHVVYRLPDHVSYEEAALTEPLANGIHMARLAPARYEDVVIIGAGTLGLMALQAYRLMGARRVVLLDTAPNRLEVARKLGADATFNPASEQSSAIYEALGGARPKIVVDAVGRSVTRRQALELLAPRGTAVMLGLVDQETSFDVLAAINREIRIQGSYASNDDDMRDALAMIADRRVDVTSWVEHFTLDSGQEIFTRLTGDPRGLVKALFLFTP